MRHNEEIKLIREMIEAPNFKKYDFRGNISKVTYDNPVSIALHQKTINEGLVNTYPLEKTIEYIGNYFNLPSDFFSLSENAQGTKTILVSVPNVGENVKLMEKAMNACGYYYATYIDSWFDENGVEFKVLQYEPKFLDVCTELLIDHEKFLYHITPRYNEKRIKAIGFSPRSKNELFKYPDRVYFLKGSTPENIVIQLTKALASNNNSFGNDGNYSIFKVGIDKNVKYYPDTNMEYGVMTYENISPKFIISIGKFNVYHDEKIKW